MCIFLTHPFLSVACKLSDQMHKIKLFIWKGGNGERKYGKLSTDLTKDTFFDEVFTLPCPRTL